MNNKQGINTNNEAFENEALKYIPYLYSIAYKLTNGNPEEAEDLVQETYKKAFTSYSSFKEGTNLKAWLHTIEKNTYINKYRKDKKFSVINGNDDEDYNWKFETALAKANPNNFSDETSNELINKALEMLDKDKRMLLYYIDVEGLSYKEAANVLSIPIGTIMSRIHRVRAEFRKNLISLYKQQINPKKDNVTADDIKEMK